MACFLVPAAEAVVVTAVYVAAKKKEQKVAPIKLSSDGKFDEKKESSKFTLSKKLSILMGLLWGGVALLAFEHLWHGEITPFAPFLTAMSNPDDKAEMLHEMSTVGVLMAVNVTCVWGVICAAIDAKAKKIRKAVKKQSA